MALRIRVDSVPLVIGSDGTVRVMGSRVTLDTIVAALSRGATAEEIARQYSSLSLVDIYAVITFYLRHQEEVDAYIQEGRIEAQRLRGVLEARFPPDGVRERLLARRRQSTADSNDTPGGR